MEGLNLLKRDSDNLRTSIKMEKKEGVFHLYQNISRLLGLGGSLFYYNGLKDSKL
ncbi:hypothetical protein I3842_16G072100 [Carya illinoinensis]|uniref:Uncharacterized protein n=1 Tax=Carya illinoinensis TaxID=32201 RepID=A0A922D141_CARIL|nr:hypothetical protein I3842_16G072100 [Carya illinoinensis]